MSLRTGPDIAYMNIVSILKDNNGDMILT
jgi:hypothetical protein